MEKQRQQGTVFVADGGELFWKSPHVPRADLPQHLLKADLIAHAYAELGIDAMTLGPSDLALGPDAVFELVDKYKLPVLGGNLRCGDHTLPGARVVERDGRKLGFVGVVGGEVPPECTLTDGLASLRAGIAELGPVDLVVVLHTQGRPFSDQVAAELPEVDLLLDGTQSAAWTAARAVAEGQAWELGSGPQGKKMGVASLTFVEGGQGWASMERVSDIEKQAERMRSRVEEAQKQAKDAADEPTRVRLERRAQHYEEEVQKLEAQLKAAQSTEGPPRNQLTHELLELNREVPDHPATQALVDAAKAQINQTPSVGTDTTPSTVFSGSSVCKNCHLEEYTQWSSTPHAQAYAALVSAQRNMDRECYSCHVTGATHPEGPQSPEAVGQLKNVGCEACHGPGAAHARAPSTAPMSSAVDPSVCTSCHDGKRDEGRFDLDSYLPKVVHGP